MPNQDQFNQFANEGYNLVPLVREVLADLETPLSTYLKLANTPYSYLLESVQGGEKWGRYSIIGLPSDSRLEVRDHHLTLIENGKEVRSEKVSDPLDEVRQFQARFSVPDIPELPRFNGGLVGFFGYETVQYIEPTMARNPVPEPVDAPDILLMVSREIVVFDNLYGRLFVVVHVDPRDHDAWSRGNQRLDSLIQQIGRGLPELPSNPSQSVTEDTFTSAFSKSDYMEAVQTCKDYITEGDAFQIVLSQRMSVPYQASPLDLYRALRTLNPSPYMYYLNLDGFHIAGASPEILVRLEEGTVTLRPIAGTRPRGIDEDQDNKFAADLLSDPKELAEHVMLIDLGRNDVGRVSEIGSVEVTDKMVIEKYSHVMHIVSNVQGKIKPGNDAIDVLKATFPAGTLSGAPKVRAMEIFQSLEPSRRGVYSGAVGYIGWNGNMDTAIAIRTALIKDNMVYVQAGAGIVADSEPIKEWEETMNKGRAVFRAVELASGGLNHPLNEEK